MIRIICVGKNKDKYTEEVCNDFIKRLSPYVNVDVCVLKEEKSSSTFPVERCIENEGAQILKNLNEGEFIVALDENGKQKSSLEFADFLKSKLDMGQTISFVIGGPFGLADTVKERADIKISLSKMTFTHQMIRPILLEQIYRSLMILKGKPYHHA